MEDTIPFCLNYNYLILKTGDIYSIATKKFLKPILSGGYLAVNIRVNGKVKLLKIHRLVAEYYIPNPDGNPLVNHKDGNRRNNRAENLEWCSQKENTEHAVQVLGNFSHPRMRKGVVQLDKNGKSLKIFESVVDARKETGISEGNIIKVCKGRQEKTGGLYFKYKDVVSPPKNAKKIPGYPRYLLTKNGEVYSKKTRVFLRPSLEYSGYLKVQLYSETSRKTFRIHKLMAITFLGMSLDSNQVVNHINCKKDDNRLSNLEICTKKENTAHSVKYGGISERKTPVRRIGGYSTKIYESIQEAGRKTGVNPSDISRVCKGKRITCGGFLWEYI